MQSFQVPCWPWCRLWLRGTISYQALQRAWSCSREGLATLNGSDLARLSLRHGLFQLVGQQTFGRAGAQGIRHNAARSLPSASCPPSSARGSKAALQARRDWSPFALSFFKAALPRCNSSVRLRSRKGSGQSRPAQRHQPSIDLPW